MSRGDVADFVLALARVYSILIIAHILAQMFLGFGGRVPYSRWSSAILGFLRDTVEPYLRIFRRFIPMIGPLDLSPLVGLILLQFVAGIVAQLIRG